MEQVEAASWCHQEGAPELRMKAPEKKEWKLSQQMAIYRIT